MPARKLGRERIPSDALREGGGEKGEAIERIGAVVLLDHAAVTT